MMSVLERLCTLLRETKETRTAEHAPFTFGELEPALRIVVEERSAELPRRISGSKISRRDALYEAEVLKGCAHETEI
jgi:hypothetical protein